MKKNEDVIFQFMSCVSLYAKISIEKLNLFLQIFFKANENPTFPCHVLLVFFYWYFPIGIEKYSMFCLMECVQHHC